MIDALRKAILARREALIEMTQDLIRVPTINPPRCFSAMATWVGN